MEVPPPWKRGACIMHDAIAAEGLAMQGKRLLPVIVLTQHSEKIQVAAPNDVVEEAI